MSKQISCDRVVPGCAFEAQAESEEELLKLVAEHAKEVHGVAQVTPELAEQVKSAIHEKG